MFLSSLGIASSVILLISSCGFWSKSIANPTSGAQLPVSSALRIVFDTAIAQVFVDQASLNWRDASDAPVPLVSE